MPITYVPRIFGGTLMLPVPGIATVTDQAVQQATVSDQAASLATATNALPAQATISDQG